MEQIETVFECGVLLMGSSDEILHQCAFSHDERLRDDDVVFVREQGKCVFNKLKTSSLEDLVDTEQINHNSIISLVWDLRQLTYLQVLYQDTVVSEIEFSRIFHFFLFFCYFFFFPCQSHLVL